MPVNTTFKVTSVSYGSTVWSFSTTGGPIEVGYNYSGNVLEDRVADNCYPTLIAIPDKSCSVTVILRDVKCILPINGTPQTLTIVFNGKDGVEVTATFPTMVFAGLMPARQARGDFGSSQLQFVHQSALGLALPIA